MPAQLRVVRRRIRTVQSTMKITRAMELISASRLARAQERVAQARPYTDEITAALESVVSTEVLLSHPLLEQRDESRAAAVLVVTSDRGLSGPYNGNVLRTAEELQARLRDDGIEPKLSVPGRKGLAYYRFRQRPIEQAWTGFSDRPSYEDARTVVAVLVEAFTSLQVDQIHAVFTDFVSASPQRAVARRFVPLVIEEVEEGPPEPIPPYFFKTTPGLRLDS